jgi:hypothetical protein
MSHYQQPYAAVDKNYPNKTNDSLSTRPNEDGFVKRWSIMVEKAMNYDECSHYCKREHVKIKLTAISLSKDIKSISQ